MKADARTPQELLDAIESDIVTASMVAAELSLSPHEAASLLARAGVEQRTLASLELLSRYGTTGVYLLRDARRWRLAPEHELLEYLDGVWRSRWRS